MTDNQYLGYSLKRVKEKNKAIVPPIELDGSLVEYNKGTGIALPYSRNEQVNFYGQMHNEFELIKKYREISHMPEAEEAIQDIVDECIVIEDDGTAPLSINLDDLDLADYIKNRIYEEFEYILTLCDFRKEGSEIFKKWYVDGRLYYYKIVDLNKKYEGIKELRYIDPISIKKIIQVNEELETDLELSGQAFIVPEYYINDQYYLYNPIQLLETPGTFSSDFNNGIKISKDSIVYVHSGLVDSTTGQVVSHLHKAIKTVNQLRMLEDAVVIYKLARSPQRRVFYVDVGNLPKHKGEEYLDNIMSRYRNQITYNQDTGELQDSRRFMSMLEDFWLPTSNGRGTKVDVLQSDNNFGEMDQIEYFQKKLYKALNLPTSRLSNETEFSIGRSSEILRDELKFSKFVSKLRNRFSEFFDDLLKTQLSLKGILTVDEWDYEIKNKIKYIFNRNNYFAELKDLEVFKERLDVADAADTYVGTYFSREYIKNKILKMTEKEIDEIHEQIATERRNGEIPESLGTDFSRVANPNEAGTDSGGGLDLGTKLGGGIDLGDNLGGGGEASGGELGQGNPGLNQGDVNLSDIKL